MSYEEDLERRVAELEAMVLFHINDKETLLDRITKEWRYLAAASDDLGSRDEASARSTDFKRAKTVLFNMMERLGHILLDFSE